MSTSVVQPLRVGVNHFPTIHISKATNVPQIVQPTKDNSVLAKASNLLTHNDVSKEKNEKSSQPLTVNELLSSSSAFEKELSQLLSPANIEFLKNRQPTTNKITNSIKSITSDPTKDSTPIPPIPPPSRKVEKMEEFDLDGRKVIDPALIEMDMLEILEKKSYSNKFTVDQWHSVVQILIDEFVKRESCVVEPESSFSYEELIFVSYIFKIEICCTLTTFLPIFLLKF